MKRDYFQDEKLNYEEIEIPDELLFMVRRTIAADRKKKAAVRRTRMLKIVSSVAAVLLFCLTIGVNSSYAFAEAAVRIPVVKDVAQAVVVRSYRPEIMAVYEENKAGRRAAKEPEVQPAEVLVENEKDTPPTPEETAGQETPEQTAAEAATGLDLWKAEMTSGKLREVTDIYAPELEQKYADTPEKLRTILLAELPEKDISLYGYHEGGTVTGTALRVKDAHQYFDWNYMDENGKLPEIFCKDIDGDGKEEILVFLHNGAVSGTETVKEETVSGGEAAEKSVAAGADANKDTDSDKTAEDAEKKEEPVAEKATEKKEESAAEKAAEKKEGSAQTEAPADSADASDTVSGNDIAQPQEPVLENKEEGPAENKQKPGIEEEKPTGELWAVSLTGDLWSASLLSPDDRKKYYESVSSAISFMIEPIDPICREPFIASI